MIDGCPPNESQLLLVLYPERICPWSGRPVRMGACWHDQARASREGEPTAVQVASMLANGTAVALALADRSRRDIRLWR